MLHIKLSGVPSVSINDNLITNFRSAKVLSLLAFLVVERNSVHSRTSLAALLWPNQTESDARHNLSQTLTRLRKSLADRGKRSIYFDISRGTIGVRSDAPLLCDLTTMLASFDTIQDHKHDSVAACDTCYNTLQSATNLIDGSVMNGFVVKDALPYEEWLVVLQEKVHAIHLTMLFWLGAAYLQRGVWDGAQAVARQQLSLEPWRELAHRQLMEALARSGQREAAIAQYDRCRALLTAEMGLDVSAETKALYNAILNGLSQLEVVSNLPPTTTPFIGRETEIAEIASRVVQKEYRLLTLLGTGGIGKTRLSIEVGRRVAQEAHGIDGVYFVGLAGVDSAENVPNTIASALDLLLTNDKNVADQVVRQLQRRSVLLILDNFEQLVDDDTAVGFVVRLLKETAGSRLLVTSRAELGLLAEDIVEVDGLQLPQSHSAGAVAGHYDAVRLFLNRARRLDKTFSLSAENTPTIVKICALLEGLPLGIELATSWLRRKSVSTILDGLTQTYDSVATRLRDIRPQHRSLRAVFDYSWSFLAANERALLGRLSVFRGGFDLQAAEAVADLSLQATKRLLEQLSAKSLVQTVGDGRYDLHGLVREFSAETLPSTTPVFDQHSRYYLTFLAASSSKIRGREPRKAIRSLLLEIDNTRYGWQYAVDQQQWATIEKSIEALTHFALLTGRAAELEQMVLLALDALPSDKRQLDPLRVDLLTAQAAMQGRMADFDLALEAGRNALAWANAHGDHERASKACLEIGFALSQSSAGVKAEMEMHERGIIHARQAGAAWLEAVHLRFLGWGRIDLNDLDSAEADFQAALNIQQQIGDVTEQQWLWLAIGINSISKTDYAGALRQLKKSLSLTEIVGHKPLESRAANALAFTQAALGDFASAVPNHERAYQIAVEIGEPVQESLVLSNLVTVERKLGNLDRATELGQKSMALAHSVASDQALVFASLHLAYVHIDAGRPQAALDLLLKPIDNLEDQIAIFTEMRAALVEALRLANRLTDAQESVEPLVAPLLTDTLFGGTDEPFQVYLNVWRTLKEADDSRASAFLTNAVRQLFKIANHIKDDNLRQSFLENVPAHAALVMASQK